MVDPSRLNAVRKLLSHVRPGNAAEKGEKADLEKDILRRKAQLSQMEDVLPRASGRYLRIILGDIDVSILDKKAKYDYKDQYERFKLILNVIGERRRKRERDRVATAWLSCLFYKIKIDKERGGGGCLLLPELPH